MDGPSVKIQKSYRDMKIPAWMDFPEEEETSSSEEWDSEEEEDEEEGDSGEEGDSEEEEEETDSEEEGKYSEDSYQKKLKRKMCIAWLLAKKEFSKKIEENHEEAFPTMIQEEDNREEVAERKKEEQSRAWWPPSAEEQSRAGWKVSEIDGRLEDISLVVFRKKAKELEKSYVTKKLRLKEAREKGVQPDMELERSNETYLEFRNMWIAIHSCWGGTFQDITNIWPMEYTDESIPLYVSDYGPPDTLEIFSVKVQGIRDGGLLSWPLQVQVFGLVAVRDSVDQHRNVIFDRPRYACQVVTKEDPYLVLTGPTRAVVMNDKSIPVTIEAELKVMSTDGSEDKNLIFAAAVLPSQFGSSGSIDLTDGSSNLKIGLGRMVACVETSIFTRVIDGTWPADSNVQFAARTSSMNHREIVLADFGGDEMPITEYGDVNLSRFVVSVELCGELTVSCKSWRDNDETMQDEVVFKAEKQGRSFGTLKVVGSCILEVLVAWSPIPPVCEELIRISEMALC